MIVVYEITIITIYRQTITLPEQKVHHIVKMTVIRIAVAKEVTKMIKRRKRKREQRLQGGRSLN